MNLNRETICKVLTHWIKSILLIHTARKRPINELCAARRQGQRLKGINRWLRCLFTVVPYAVARAASDLAFKIRNSICARFESILAQMHTLKLRWAFWMTVENGLCGMALRKTNGWRQMLSKSSKISFQICTLTGTSVLCHRGHHQTQTHLHIPIKNAFREHWRKDVEPKNGTQQNDEHSMV